MPENMPPTGQADIDALRQQLGCLLQNIEIPGPFPLLLPGGVQLEHVNLQDLIQPALAPLVPLLNIVDVVVAVVNCVKAIPDALGPPPDPTAITNCLPDLTEKVAQLMRLIPQLWLPLTVVQAIDLLISVLQQVQSELNHLQQQMHSMLAAMDRARELDDAGLMAILQCAQADVAQESVNVGKRLASLGKLVGLLNLFLGILGLPELPPLANLAGMPLDDAIAAIDPAIAALTTARNAIPIPPGLIGGGN